MDRTNILQIFDELSAAHPDTDFSINFSSNTKPEVNEPSVLITTVTERNMAIPFYLSSTECQEITKEELESAITMLIKQETYRRKLIFKNATLSTQVKWE